MISRVLLAFVGGWCHKDVSWHFHLRRSGSPNGPKKLVI